MGSAPRRALGAGALTAAQQAHARLEFRRRWLWPGLLAPPLCWTEARAPGRRGQLRVLWAAFSALLAACSGARAPPVTAVADSLLRTTALVASTCLRVVSLRDTLDQERQQRRVQATARLPQKLQDSVRVRDSLRALRWSTP